MTENHNRPMGWQRFLVRILTNIKLLNYDK